MEIALLDQGPDVTNEELADAVAAFGVRVDDVKGHLASRTLLASSLAVTSVILTAGLSMFPFITPSSTDPRSSLTAWDGVSSHRTLQTMFWVVMIFLPFVMGYTTWVYRRCAARSRSKASGKQPTLLTKACHVVFHLDPRHRVALAFGIIKGMWLEQRMAAQTDEK